MQLHTCKFYTWALMLGPSSNVYRHILHNSQLPCRDPNKQPQNLPPCAAIWQHKRVGGEALYVESVGWDAKPPVISPTKILFVEKQQNTFSSIKLKIPWPVNYAVCFDFVSGRCWVHSAPSWTSQAQHLFWSVPWLFQCSPFWGPWLQQRALVYT